MCTTAACTEFARVINENLASNYSEIDPCDDFATYVCGGWQDTHTYRPDQSSVTAFSLLSDENNAIMRAILENPYPGNSSYSGANDTANRENFAKMQTTFNACMDLDAIKQAGVTPLKDLFNDLPGAAVTYGHTGDLTDSLIWLAQHGVSALVSAGTGVSKQAIPQLKPIPLMGSHKVLHLPVQKACLFTYSIKWSASPRLSVH